MSKAKGDSKNSVVDSVSEESDEQDDSVIGTAFLGSVITVAVIAVIAGVMFFLLRSNAEKPKEVETIVTAPKLRNSEVVELPEIPFADVTTESGIDFVHFSGKEGERLLPETMGGGGGFFDFDNDGDEDLLFVNGSDWPWSKQKSAEQPTMKLYANDGVGQFTDVTVQVGLDVAAYGMGCAFGDFDSDGWVDVYITNVGQNLLFRNDGGKFEDVTEQFGVGGDDTQWSCPAAWMDYDRDGRLDLLVGDYVDWSREYDIQQNSTLAGLERAYGQPTSFGGTLLKLYRNRGDSFEEVAESAGLHVFNSATGVPIGKSLAFGLMDANQDGWLDFVVANDTVQNFMFLNQQDGTFKELGVRAGVAFDNNGKATGAMGVDAAHYRNDETLAIAIGNFANEPSSIFVSRGKRLQFFDAGVATGLGPQTKLPLTFGMFFVDLDLDGRQDMVCSNGHLEEEIARVQPTQQYAQSPQIFWNAGLSAPSEWTELTENQIGNALPQPIVGRGTAYADIDNDGDVDLLLMSNSGAPRLMRNDVENDNHWLRIRLRSSEGNLNAIGATVQLTVGDQLMQRTVTPTHSYLSQSELTVTFGIGTTTAVDSVRVIWPDGTEQQVEISSVDQTLTVEKTTNG